MGPGIEAIAIIVGILLTTPLIGDLLGLLAALLGLSSALYGAKNFKDCVEAAKSAETSRDNTDWVKFMGSLPGWKRESAKEKCDCLPKEGEFEEFWGSAQTVSYTYYDCVCGTLLGFGADLIGAGVY